ncbi:MAG: hypothetical protein AVDCRST_MAG43-466 [uncultured Thermomicrobiales bacterium]|uniref:Uncharacterized protein n=1 Tax=uncultured Thermomicrobiales bacterium TaxID=1645740 RepID=A0A6J4UB65_9BACT|nr:MAG: hypothetical protein AVDCRST_MAG43-466 [uncultured Thermomicrobiales bacterium]
MGHVAPWPLHPCAITCDASPHRAHPAASDMSVCASRNDSTGWCPKSERMRPIAGGSSAFVQDDWKGWTTHLGCHYRENTCPSSGQSPVDMIQ